MIQEIKNYEIKEEIEDNEINLFNAINKRIKNNEKIKFGKYYVGPPDILYLVREPIKQNFYFNFKLKKSKSQQKYKKINSPGGKKFGTYIYIYGMDTSNLFSVENYINTYIEKQKKFFELNNKENKDNKDNEEINKINNSIITKAVFCSYDFFLFFRKRFSNNI